MIGTKIISEHHLSKLATHTPQLVLFQYNQEWQFGVVVLRKRDTTEDKAVVLFNRRFNDGLDNAAIVRKEYGNEFFDRTLHYLLARNVAFYGKGTVNFHNAHIDEMILLPNSFLSDYEQFQNSNKKALGRNLISTFNVESLSPNFAYIYCLTHTSKNLYAWAFKAHINGVRLNVIKEIVLWYEKYGGTLSKGLKRATITAYSGYDQVLGVVDEIRQLRQDKQITDIMNSFNTSQKKILKNVERNKLTVPERIAFGKFGQLSLTKRQNFIQKMSTVENAYEIIRQMCFLTSSHFDWNITSFMEFLKNAPGLKCKVVTSHNGIVLLSVDDFDTVKKLAKTTNWCISKNKSYWNNYNRDNTTQYILFDFTKPEDDLLSIIGFTSVASKGISAAHDFKNNNMMGRGSTQVLSTPLTRYLPSNIFNILCQANISLDTVISLPNAPKEWNKRALLDYLYKRINPSSIKVVKDENNQMCLEVSDSSILEIFDTREYSLDLSEPEYTYGYKFLLFADFNRPYTSSNAFVIAVIVANMYGEESSNGTFHALLSMTTTPQFDELLTQYDMPYDTIRRIGNDDTTFIRKFNDFTISFDACANNVEKLKSNITALCKMSSRDSIRHNIEYSIETLSSLDYVKMIYATDNSLLRICGEEIINSLIMWLDRLLRTNRVANGGVNWKIKQLTEMEEKFLAGNAKYNYTQATIANALVMVNTVLSNEMTHNLNAVKVILQGCKKIPCMPVTHYYLLLIVSKYISLADYSVIRDYKELIANVDNQTVASSLRQSISGL